MYNVRPSTASPPGWPGYASVVKIRMSPTGRCAPRAIGVSIATSASPTPSVNNLRPFTSSPLLEERFEPVEAVRPTHLVEGEYRLASTEPFVCEDNVGPAA